MTIKVSIIVPVYNCEKHLARCLDSLTNQTLKDIEIILINDGSIDNSGAICDKYSIMDNRIVVIHKKNSGISDTRNLGINVAQGEYIGFVDSDDFVELRMFEKLYTAAIQNKCDVSICNYYSYFNKDNFYISNENLKEGIYDSDTILMKFIGNNINEFEKPFYLASVWRCLYKKALISKTKFPPIKTIEDRLFNIEILCKTKNVYYLSEALYYYFYNTSSITKTYQSEMIKDYVYSNEKVYYLLGDRTFIFEEQLFTSKLRHYVTLIRNEANINNKNNINKSIRTLNEYSNLINFHEPLFKQVRKHMGNKNKLIFGLLKKNKVYFVLLVYKTLNKIETFRKSLK